ncbi:uncharacterized protein IUM83_13193 [Phytophthora cinnamomi]|uniref:uncharacterized protein n=1 Tax=Phytophthora cinnamomi TaxID=4785 RepID=UPI00355941C8|nr:hypothetical protein IUM83_13193 [Phytophthora cinnamomi]
MEIFPERDENIEYWIRKGTALASTSIIHKSTFEHLPGTSSVKMASECNEAEGVSKRATSEERMENVGEKVKATKPNIPPDENEGMVSDFSESKLSLEQKEMSRL